MKQSVNKGYFDIFALRDLRMNQDVSSSLY